MCIHEPIKRIIITLMSKMAHIPSDTMRDDIVWSLVGTLVVIAVCVPMIIAINKCFPWMIGKKI